MNAGRTRCGSRSRRFRWFRPVWLVVAVLAAGACEQRPPATSRGAADDSGSPVAAQAPVSPSPRAALARLIELRAARRFGEMDELIVPPRGPEVVNLLLAVEEFLAANERLCTYVRDEVGVGIAQRVDQSGLGNFLDIFSPNVALLDEEIQGDLAVVPYTVDGALPTRETRVRRIDGVWKYDAGDGFTDELPAAFRRMARGLDDVLDDLRRGQLTPNQIRADPRRLMGLVAERLRPGIRLLPPGPGPEETGR